MSGVQYYMPYYDTDDDNETTNTHKSENDTASQYNTDTDYDSDNLPDSEDPRIRREEDPRYAIIKAAGPSFNTSSEQLQYQTSNTSDYMINTKSSDLNNSLLYNVPVTTTQTSLFSIKSSNRDKSVYPYSSNFSLKLPRVYKNITKFQLVQLSFPYFVNAVTDISGFISTVVQIISPYISPSCISSCFDILQGQTSFTSFGVYEEGRVNENQQPMYLTVSIPPGAYNPPELVKLLNIHSNNTPPFNAISYNDFKQQFLISGDHTILFNEAGDHFHTNLTANPISNPTKHTIISHYFPDNTFTGILNLTEQHAFVTYYYPILKELIASNRGVETYLDTIGYSYEQVTQMVLHHFLGIDNIDYYNLCMANQTLLDRYRRFHTFELRTVNKYIWSYNEAIQQFGVIHNTLHTSLLRDIQNSRNKLYTNELTLQGLNSFTFKSLNDEYLRYKSIFTHIHSIVSTNLGNSHGVTNYGYGDPLPETLADIENNVTSNGITLNGLSNFTSTIGGIGGVYGVFPGISFTSATFSTLHSSMEGYSTLTGNRFITISSIHGNVAANHHSYISSKYSGILPDSILTTKSYNNNNAGLPVGLVTNKYFYVSGSPVNNNATEGDCAQICRELIEKELFSYYSCLPVNSIVNNLAYKLGIWNPTSISSISVLSTLGSLGSFGNFNVLIQINTDQSFNNMDIAMNENYKITNETTGQVKYVTGKILTSGLGSNDISQTVIINPILFDGTLGKLDKLSIRLLIDDDALTPLDAFFPFDLPFTEWDATFQIDEEVAQADKSNIFNIVPSVQIPANMRPF
jgi:hypothetical protein